MAPLTSSRAKELYQLFKTCSGEEFRNLWYLWYEELVSAVFIGEDGEILPIPATNKAVLLLFEQFFRVCQQFPTISREVGSQHLPHLLQKFDVFEEENLSDNMVPMIKLLLSFYPTVFTKYSKNVRSYLCKFSDNPNPALRSFAAQCFALLPNVGPAGEKQLKHAENWSKQFKFILIEAHNNLHTLIGISNAKRMASNLCKFSLKPDDITAVSTMLSFDEIAFTDIQKFYYRIDFCLACLGFMIRHPFDYRVEIPLSSVIELFRCFTVSSNHLRANSSDIRIRDILHKANNSFLKFFAVIPITVVFTLAPYAADIYDLLETNLHVLSSNDYSESAAESICFVYDILNEIVLRCGAMGKLQMHLSKFWRYFKKDLQADRSTTKATTNIEGGGGRGGGDVSVNSDSVKRKKKRKHLDDSADIDQFVVKEKDFDVQTKRFNGCCKLLTTVCQRIGTTIKPALYRELQASVCHIALNMQINNTSANLLFNDVDRRLNLYSLLSALIACRHPTCPPAISVVAQIFQRGCRDVNANVSSICNSYMQMLNCITKPLVPSLECVKALEDINKPPVEEAENEEAEEDDVEEEDSNLQNEVVANNLTVIEPKRSEAVFEDVSSEDEQIVVNIDSETDDDDIETAAAPPPPPPPSTAAKKFKPDSSYAASFTIAKVRSELSTTEKDPLLPDCLLLDTVNEMMADFVDQPADS